MFWNFTSVNPPACTRFSRSRSSEARYFETSTGIAHQKPDYTVAEKADWGLQEVVGILRHEFAASPWTGNSHIDSWQHKQSSLFIHGFPMQPV